MIEERRLADPTFQCDANPDADPDPLQGDANLQSSARIGLQTLHAINWSLHGSTRSLHCSTRSLHCSTRSLHGSRVSLHGSFVSMHTMHCRATAVSLWCESCFSLRSELANPASQHDADSCGSWSGTATLEERGTWSSEGITRQRKKRQEKTNDGKDRKVDARRPAHA